MKTALLLIISVNLMIGTTRAENQAEALTSLKTLSGSTYTGVKVIKADPDGLVFRHQRGIAKISFADLPPEVQQRFNYKPEAAAAFVKEHLEAERIAAEKAAQKRAERRQKEQEAKMMEWQLNLARQQAAASAGYAVPAFVDYGVPTWGYGADYGAGNGWGWGIGGGNDRPRYGHGARPKELFYDYATANYIGPYSGLHSGAVTNSNVRPTLTFGGYRYPTALAAPNDIFPQPWGGVRPGPRSGGVGGSGNVMRPVPSRRLVPANTGGARIGGTGGLIHSASPRISHH